MIPLCLEAFVSCLTKETFCLCIVVLHEICLSLPRNLFLARITAALLFWHNNIWTLLHWEQGCSTLLNWFYLSLVQVFKATCEFTIWLKLWGALRRALPELMLWSNTRWTPGSSEAVWILCYVFSFRKACTKSSFIATSIPSALMLHTCIQYYYKLHQFLANIMEIIAVAVVQEQHWVCCTQCWF